MVGMTTVYLISTCNDGHLGCSQSTFKMQLFKLKHNSIMNVSLPFSSQRKTFQVGVSFQVQGCKQLLWASELMLDREPCVREVLGGNRRSSSDFGSDPPSSLTVYPGQVSSPWWASVTSAVIEGKAASQPLTGPLG